MMLIKQTVSTLILISLVILAGVAQSPAKKAKKADHHYKLKQYALAIPLYRAALKEKANRAWLYKLGNCYRIINRPEEALPVFEELFKDPRRLRAKAYRHYSEVLMSCGKYEQAKAILKEYVALAPDDENAPVTLANMDKIGSIRPLFPDAEVERFEHNSKADDLGPTYWRDDLIFVSDRKQGMNIFKEKTGSTGRDYLGVYHAKKNDSGYDAPKMLTRKINLLNRNTGPISFTEDGNTVVYSQNDHNSDASKLSLQLFTAKWEGGKWRDIQKVNFCQSGINYMHPSISADGKRMFYACDKRSNAEGGLDLYMTTLRPDGKWSRPENLGPIVNTPTHEAFPYYGKDDKLYFCSRGHVGYGGFDIFVTQMDQFGNWKRPVNLGRPINSPQDDIGICMGAEGENGMLASSRLGGDDNLFYFRLNKKDRGDSSAALCVKVRDADMGSVLEQASLLAIPLNMDDGAKGIRTTIKGEETKLHLKREGEYEISIYKEGYKPYSKSIHWDGKQKIVEVTLTKRL